MSVTLFLRSSPPRNSIHCQEDRSARTVLSALSHTLSSLSYCLTTLVLFTPLTCSSCMHVERAKALSCDFQPVWQTALDSCLQWVEDSPSRSIAGPTKTLFTSRTEITDNQQPELHRSNGSLPPERDHLCSAQGTSSPRVGFEPSSARRAR